MSVQQSLFGQGPVYPTSCDYEVLRFGRSLASKPSNSTGLEPQSNSKAFLTTGNVLMWQN